MSYIDRPADLMLEKDKSKRNAAVDGMTEQEAKEFLKQLLNVGQIK